MIACHSPSLARRGDNRNASRAGVTLLELTVYVAVIGVVTGPVVTAMLVGVRTTTESSSYTMLQERNRSALDRLAREVRSSMEGTIVVSATNPTVTMTVAAGFDGVNVIPGPSISYRLRASDTDGWGELVRLDNDTGGETTICGRVDLQASGFQAVGNGVRLTLSNTSDTRDQADGLRVTTTISSFPRN